jgi:DNA polymerase I
MSTNNSLFLVDGSSLAYRSFFALIKSGMRNSSKIPTWAVYGFLNSLFDLMDKRAPHSMAVCFDLAGPTFRHEEFEDYKANRQEMPDDLSVQWPFIKQAVEVFSIPIYELAGWEADDVIGTVAKKAKERDLTTVIFTGDQDSFQLLDENIQVLMPLREGGVKDFGRQEVFDKLGIWPEQVIDYKGLCGDASDNIPGVRGIGPKTAVQLLGEYKTLENVYANVNAIAANSVRTKLIDGREKAFASQRLARIVLDVPLEFDFDHCHLRLPDVNRVCEFLREMEFRNLLRRLPRILANFNNGVEPEIDPSLLQVAAKARGATGGKSAAQAQKAASREAAQSPSAPVQLALLEMPESPVVLDSAVRALAPSVPAKLILTASELTEAISAAKSSGLVAVSVITSGDLWFQPGITGIALASGTGLKVTENNRLELSEGEWNVNTWYIPLNHVGGNLEHSLVSELLQPLLQGDQIAKIAFDCKVAMHALENIGIELKPVTFDPMLASYITNPVDRHRLRDQASRCLGYAMADFSQASGSKKITPADMSGEQFASFAAEELRVTLELTRYYVEKFDFDQQELLWGMDLPTASVLSRMERNGIALDVAYFKELQEELETGIRRLEREIFGLIGYSFNVGSPQQLQQVLFTDLKLPTKGRTQTGFSTDASVLEALVDAHPVVQKILDYRELTKLNSTYVVSLPRQISQRDDRLHGEFNQTVAATGRLSGSNPNLQNIPIRTELGARIRKGFVPSDPSSLILSADYSQIELRLLAHMSGDENLIEAFTNDEDIHTSTARLIFDLSPDKVTSDHRRIGKTLNFALIYQQGAYATGLALGISTREAKSFTEKYFKSFPKVKSFMTRVLEEARERGFVETLWGRRRYFHNLNDSNDGIRRTDERAAFNAPLQGSAADLMKLAMIKLDEELRTRKLKSKLILQVHDELVLEVPENEKAEAEQIVRDAMGMGQPLLIPLKIDVGFGANWMDAK